MLICRSRRGYQRLVLSLRYRMTFPCNKFRFVTRLPKLLFVLTDCLFSAIWVQLTLSSLGLLPHCVSSVVKKSQPRPRIESRTARCEVTKLSLVLFDATTMKATFYCQFFGRLDSETFTNKCIESLIAFSCAAGVSIDMFWKPRYRSYKEFSASIFTLR